MRCTNSLAYVSLRIERSASASSARAYKVASMVSGAPERSTRIFEVSLSIPPEPNLRLICLRCFRFPPCGAQLHEEARRRTDRLLHGFRLPAELTDRLAVVHRVLGAHQPQRSQRQLLMTLSQ